MLHIRGFGGNPLGGLSTLSFGRQTFGLAQAIERASGDTFRNGVRPSGLLKTADTLTIDQRKQAEELLQEKFAGAINAGRPMLLDRGMDWVQLSISPEDAQMLQSRAFSVEEVCRFFGVPPFMIGDVEKTTAWGSGVEHMSLGFVRYTLQERLTEIEQELTRKLFRTATTFSRFNVEGLLRGDTAARAAYLREMVGGSQGPGIITQDEARRAEGFAPLGGDADKLYDPRSASLTATTDTGAPANA